MQKNHLLITLMANRMLSTEEEIRNFREALNKLARAPDNQLLPDLFLVFDDAAENIPPLQSLLRFIEQFDMEIRIRSLVQVTPALLDNAREWLDIFYLAVVGDPESKQYLKELLPTLPEKNRTVLRQLLKDLAEKDFRDQEMKTSLKRDVEFILA